MFAPRVIRSNSVFSLKSEAFLAALTASIIGLLLFLVFQPSNFERRMDDFSRIRSALEAARRETGHYPEGGGSAIGAAGSYNKEWIAGLVPRYINRIPRDPRNSREANVQYVYISDGANFKFIAHAPEDFGYVRQRHPELVDPRRSDYAYGIWTEGAAKW